MKTAQSPCTGVCRLVDGKCTTCKRTSKEVAHWIRFTEEERLKILEDLKNRE